MHLSPYEAAKILYKNGQKTDSEILLRRLWEFKEQDHSKRFVVLCALIEIQMLKAPRRARDIIEDVVQGAPEWHNFWLHCSLLEQSIFFEWYGQLSFFLSDDQAAFEGLTRSASLGRDTSELWFLLGVLKIKKKDLNLSIRYLKRSLELHRQPGLDLFSQEEGCLGAFLEEHPLGFNPGALEYLTALLELVRLTEGKKSLRPVKELILEMIHQFPEEERLPKIRCLVEQNLARSNLTTFDSEAKVQGLEASK